MMRLRPLVGRAPEVAAIDGALAAHASSAVIRVSGPVGIGKSALLHHVIRSCFERRAPLRRLDPLTERVDGAAVQRALAELGERTEPRCVLVIDDLHLARDAERWLVTNAHTIGDSITVFLGDRQPMSIAWMGGAVAPPLELALGPLDGAAVTALFAAYETSLASSSVAAAEGNPLLLTLFAEKRGPTHVEDALLRLANTLFPAYEEPARIAGLAVLTTAPATTYERLGNALGDLRQARDVMRWLRSLSVIDNTSAGLVPHPVARRACAAMLRIHHPAAHEAAVKAAAPSLEEELGAASRVLLAWSAERALAVGAEAATPATPAPQFSKLLRDRLDDLARQSSLTDREREVFELLVLGRSANEMAIVLGITTRTVKFHQQRVLEKIGADSRLDILRLLL